MKVLNVNKFYNVKGGSETYLFGLEDLLRKNNHISIPFSMKDDKNIQNEYESYFIDHIDYKNMKFNDKISSSFKIIYSLEARRKIKKIIEDTSPEIAHLHIYQHQMSPSIIHELKKYDIPIVNTVHDLKVVCPNYKMLNKNGVCEECKGGKYYKCFKYGCTKDSKLYSLVNVIECYLHKYLKSYSLVDRFICPSKFYKQKLIEFGIEEKKVEYIPNFVDSEKFEPSYEYEDYFIYIGRLSEEKGIMTLLEAMNQVKESKLKIVGTGPLAEAVSNRIKQMKLSNVELLGFKSGDELKNIIQKSRFMVIPSEWYENGPMSVLECMAYGKAILGSNMGGIPELIEDGKTGYVFKAGNQNELASKINLLLQNELLTVDMGKMARTRIENIYDKKHHYDKIIKVYNEVAK